MIVLAHIFGVPIEEYALPWIGGGAGAGILIVLASKLPRVRSNSK